ncbi:MAG TPA: PAS domain S-box protein [Balneolaceae bacterium]
MKKVFPVNNFVSKSALACLPAAVWIYFSGSPLSFLIAERVLIATYQTYIGLFFLLAASALWYKLISRIAEALKVSNECIERLMKREQEAYIETEKAKLKLAEEHNLLRSIIDNHQDYIYVKDQQRRFVVSNKAQNIEIFGTNSERAVIGKTAYDLFEPKTAEAIDSDDRKVIESGVPIINREEAALDVKGNKIWLLTTKLPLRNQNDDIYGLVGITHNITEKKKISVEIKLLKERYEMVLKATKDIVYDWDVSSNSLLWSQNFKTIFGHDLNKEEYTIEKWAEKIHPDDQQHTYESLMQALGSPSESEWRSEYRFKKADGSYAAVLERGFITRNEKGQVTRMVGALEDITERKQYEKRLQNTEQRLRDILENSTNMFYAHNANHEITYVSPQSREFLGCGPEEAMKRWTEFITNHPVNKKGLESAERAIKTCQPQPSYELELKKKNGEIIWVEVNEAPVVRDGQAEAIVGSLTDITERKETEKKLHESLKEKEVLLTEVHHRVKNNLAVVSGMMQLQAFDEEKSELKSKLIDNVTRIQSMAYIHEHLYQSDSFSDLDFSANLKELIEGITATIPTETDITLEFNTDPVQLNVNQAMPASLIVNEVVTNILKHAFKDMKKGKITSELAQIDDQVKLWISDNGIGLPEDFSKGKTLGLQLINELSRQLAAEYEYKSTANGSLFILGFEKSDSKGIGNAAL